MREQCTESQYDMIVSEEGPQTNDVPSTEGSACTDAVLSPHYAEHIDANENATTADAPTNGNEKSTGMEHLEAPPQIISDAGSASTRRKLSRRRRQRNPHNAYDSIHHPAFSGSDP